VPADFTLAQLQYFCAVAETGSFTSAAMAERVSATAVSAAVTALETAVGAQLCIRRRSQGVELTAIGQTLYEQARSVLAHADELRLVVATGGRELSGALRVGCTPEYAPTALAPLAEGLTDQHPRVMLRFHVAGQSEVLAGLAAGELDCAIVTGLDLPEALGRRELFHTEPHVVVGGGHRLATRRSVTVPELEGEALVLVDSEPVREATLALLSERGVEPVIRFRTADHELARAIIGRNLGYSIALHDTGMDRSWEARKLVRVPISPAVHRLPITLVWMREGERPEPLDQLLDSVTRLALRVFHGFHGRL
jgi:DNA-binding transcriptional LysR family regulator